MDHAQLVSTIGGALAELQAAYDDRDRALAEYLGVGRTDLRCLDLIVRHGPQTASSLGVQLHLTRGSMTSLIDRLERAGYARRHDDPTHGKRKLIAPTQLLADAIIPAVGPRQRQGAHELDAYDDRDLQVILRFLQSTLALQSAVREHYQSMSPVTRSHGEPERASR